MNNLEQVKKNTILDILLISKLKYFFNEFFLNSQMVFLTQSLTEGKSNYYFGDGADMLCF